jgi:hypothetical protein
MALANLSTPCDGLCSDRNSIEEVKSFSFHAGLRCACSKGKLHRQFVSLVSLFLLLEQWDYAFDGQVSPFRQHGAMQIGIAKLDQDDESDRVPV